MVLAEARRRRLVHEDERLHQLKPVFVSLQLAIDVLEVRRELGLLDFEQRLGELQLHLLNRAGVFLVVLLVEEVVDVF